MIVNGIAALRAGLNLWVLAEGTETNVERDLLRDAGIDLMQEYLFCKPAFLAIGVIDRSAWDCAQGP